MHKKPLVISENFAAHQRAVCSTVAQCYTRSRAIDSYRLYTSTCQPFSTGGPLLLTYFLGNSREQLCPFRIFKTFFLEDQLLRHEIWNTHRQALTFWSASQPISWEALFWRIGDMKFVYQSKSYIHQALSNSTHTILNSIFQSCSPDSFRLNNFWVKKVNKLFLMPNTVVHHRFFSMEKGIMFSKVQKKQMQLTCSQLAKSLLYFSILLLHSWLNNSFFFWSSSPQVRAIS